MAFPEPIQLVHLGRTNHGRRERRSPGRIRKWALTHTPTSFSRYLVAATALAAALLFRYLFRDSLGLRAPYLQFYPALIVAAWYGGRAPALRSPRLRRSSRCTGCCRPPDLPSTIRRTSCLSACSSPPGWRSPGSTTVYTRAGGEACGCSDRGRARAERLDAILNTTADGVIVIDATGVVEWIQSCGRAALRISRGGSRRTKRQSLDAFATPRGARPVPPQVHHHR